MTLLVKSVLSWIKPFHHQLQTAKQSQKLQVWKMPETDSSHDSPSRPLPARKVPFDTPIHRSQIQAKRGTKLGPVDWLEFH